MKLILADNDYDPPRIVSCSYSKEVVEDMRSMFGIDLPNELLDGLKMQLKLHEPMKHEPIVFDKNHNSMRFVVTSDVVEIDDKPTKKYTMSFHYADGIIAINRTFLIKV